MTAHPPLTRGAQLLAAWLATTETSQRAMARQLDLGPSTVQAWMSGRKRPSLAVATSIERVTGVPATSWAEPPRKKIV